MIIISFVFSFFFISLLLYLFLEEIASNAVFMLPFCCWLMDTNTNVFSLQEPLSDMERGETVSIKQLCLVKC